MKRVQVIYGTIVFGLVGALFALSWLINLANWPANIDSATPIVEATVVFLVEAGQRLPAWLIALLFGGAFIAYLILLFGTDGLVAFSRFFYRRDARVAAYIKLENDEAVKCLRLSLLARIILEVADWRPLELPNLPEATSAEAYKNRPLPGDEMRFVLSAPSPLYQVERLYDLLIMGTRNIGDTKVEATLNECLAADRARFLKAGQDALMGREEWPRRERGRVFYDETDRARWHRLYAETIVANQLVERFYDRLKVLAKAWQTPPGSDLTLDMIRRGG